MIEIYTKFTFFSLTQTSVNFNNFSICFRKYNVNTSENRLPQIYSPLSTYYYFKSVQTFPKPFITKFTHKVSKNCICIFRTRPLGRESEYLQSFQSQESNGAFGSLLWTRMCRCTSVASDRRGGQHRANGTLAIVDHSFAEKTRVLDFPRKRDGERIAVSTPRLCFLDWVIRDFRTVISRFSPVKRTWRTLDLEPLFHRCARILLSLRAFGRKWEKFVLRVVLFGLGLYNDRGFDRDVRIVPKIILELWCWNFELWNLECNFCSWLYQK